MLELTPMDEKEEKSFLESGEPTTGEFFVENIKEGFDQTIPGVAIDQMQENFASGNDAKAVRDSLVNSKDGISRVKLDETLKTFTQDEWKTSPYFRKGVKFEDGWSEARAQHYAESFDEREQRTKTIEAGNPDGLFSGKGAVGFVGQMFGGLPDPINLIPFGSGVKAGGKLATKVLQGAVEGAVGNIAVSAVTRPYYQDRGVESGFNDYVNDLFMGTVMGGGFSALGHGASKLKEFRENAKLSDRKVVGDISQEAVSAVQSGDGVNLNDKLPAFNEQIRKMRELPEVLKSEEVQRTKTQLEDLGYSPEEIDANVSVMAAQAEFFSTYENKTFTEAMADIQGARMEGDKIVPDKSSSPKVNEFIESELMNMKEEITFAQKGGEKLFIDGQYVSTSGEGSFPDWYKDAGIKNKAHLDKVLEAKKGPIYERLTTLAEERLINGYESPARGRVEPANEFRKLKGEGEILFKKKGEVTKGAFQPDKNLISIFKDADRSTLIHETGHLILKNLDDLGNSGNAMAKADLATMKKSFGFDPEKPLTQAEYVDFHENFARGFERYLMEGVAPTKALEGAFGRFKTWLSQIYKQAEKLNVNLSDDARAVYAKILGSESAPAPAKVEVPEPRFKDEASLDAAVNSFDTAINEAELKGASAEDIQVLRDILSEVKAEEGALDEAFTLFQKGDKASAIRILGEQQGISKSKMDELIEVFNNKLLAEDDQRLALEKFVNDQKIALAAEAKEAKRQAFLTSEAKLRVAGQVNKIIKLGKSPTQGFLSQIEGDSTLRGIEGAGNSADGAYTALAQSTSSKCYNELKAIDPKIENLFENDIHFNQKVIEEMITPGSTKDEAAKAAGEILSRYSEELRQRANLAGATIGKLEGHTPRSHDVEKMLGRRSEWVAFMKANLDLDRSYSGLKGSELDSALEKTFESLVTGEHDSVAKIDINAPVIKSPRNIAKKMGESRSLHFNDAKAEMTYLKEFGQGDNILQSMSSHYDSMAKKITMMEKFGPNPESTIGYLLEKTRLDIRDRKIMPDLDDVARDKVLKELGTVNQLKSRDSTLGQALMHALGETDTTEGWFKNMTPIIRGVQSLSKLGSALLAQPTDFVHALNEKRILTDNNLLTNWVETMQDYLKGSGDQFQEIIEHAGMFVDGINYKNFNRFDGDNINGVLGRWNDKMHRWSGQSWHSKHAKNGVAISLSRELGKNIDKPWDQVHKGLRETLTQYGSITKERWALLQTVKSKNIEGKDFYHPGMIKDVADEKFDDFLPEDLKLKNRPMTEQALPVDGSDAAEVPKSVKDWEARRADQIRREKLRLETDLKTFFVEEGRNAAPEPDAKVRRQMAFGTKKGSNASEAVKLFTQFKTFAFVNWDRSIKGKRMMRESGDYGGIMHHAAATLILGYASTALKDLAKGLVPADPTEGKTWTRAAFQSGGLGIMGDFVQAGVSSRSGADAMSTLAGPTFSTVGNLINLSGKTIRGDVITDGAGLTSDWVDFGRSLAPAPLSSLVYTRAAMDYLVWSQIKESLEPGSIRRTERRLKKEYNQQSIMNAMGF